jgi:dihydroflavonol-4-reductase
MAGSADVMMTGASGFVGSAILRELLLAGFRVRALVRRTSRYDDLQTANVEFIEADLRDAAAVQFACAGCRYVFHVAADYRLSLWDGRTIMAVNVCGTRNVMEQALKAGVERLVYTSSVATLGRRKDDSEADETDILAPQMAIGAYKRSKIIAERLVLEMIREKGLPAVIVNPSAPLGPRDVRPTPTGRILIAAASGQFPVFVDTGLNLVHVDDVAAGHLAALRKGRIGERYILGGQNVRLSEMLAEVATLTGRPAPKISIPSYLAMPAAVIGEASAFLTGREPLTTWAGVRLAAHTMFFSSAKAAQELAFNARPYRVALRDALAWFAAHGYIANGLNRRIANLGHPFAR